MVNTNNINLKPLGEILIDQGYLTQDQLEEGLKQRVLGLRLGGSLIYQQLINAEQLAHALAIQADVDYHMIDPYMLDKELIQGFSDQLALHYAVLPIRIYENTLYLASESRIDPVSIAALSRKTGYKIKYFIVSRGQAVLGLRYWYARHKMQNDEELLIKAFKKSWITKEQKNDIWRTYESSQVLMAEILTSLGYLSPSVLAAVLLRHANTILPLGEFFVKEGIVTQDVVDQALGLQQKLQYTITELLTLEGLTQSQLNELKGDY